MKTFIAALLIWGLVAAGQTTPSKPPITYETHYATKHTHHTRNWIIGIGIPAAMVTGVLIWGRQPSCNHYEYGQNGVNMPCPKEPISSKKR